MQSDHMIATVFSGNVRGTYKNTLGENYEEKVPLSREYIAFGFISD